MNPRTPRTRVLDLLYLTYLITLKKVESLEDQHTLCRYDEMYNFSSLTSKSEKHVGEGQVMCFDC